MITVVGGVKGGSGKTTMAFTFAYLTSVKDKKTTLLLDADEQKSSTALVLQREDKGYETPWNTLRFTGKMIDKELSKLKKVYECIIVDVGGWDSVTQRHALKVADNFVIPFRPRPLDAWTSENIEPIIEDAIRINTKLRILSFLNQAEKNRKNREGAIQIISEKINCLPYCIGNRIAFSNAQADGGTIFDRRGNDSVKEEVLKVYNEIFNFDVNA